MISVMNGINNPASFGFSGSFMDKPFYQKFTATNVTTPVSVAAVVTTAAATAASSSSISVSSATNENDRTSTPPALATRCRITILKIMSTASLQTSQSKLLKLAEIGKYY